MGVGRAGLLYFAIAFAAGFVLGTLRVLVLAQHLGEFPATLLELPLMLALGWFLAGRLVRRLERPTPARRFAMGVLALALLLAAEAALGILGFGRSLAGHLAAYAEAPKAAGLAAQGLYALLPLLRGTGRAGLRLSPASRRG